MTLASASKARSRRAFLMGTAGALLAGYSGPRAEAQAPADQRWVYSISDFDDGGSDGWLPGFSDFSLQTASTNRVAEVRRLPSEVTGGGSYGYYLRGRNTSDDLFMFIKKPITGLEANQSYHVSFLVELASAAPSNCVGIGGAPGESVWLKVGATTQEPLALLEGDDIRFSADKGNQSSGGRDGVIAGDIANGVPCEQARGEFVLISRTARLQQAVQASISGNLWVFAGTDSGFEGTTEVYYAFIAVLLTRAD
jgi:hypothetical protein